MIDAARVLGVFGLVFLALGCKESVESTDIRTTGIYPEITMEAEGSGSSTVTPPVRARESSLVRFTSRVELAGRYRDVRAFIHQLETAPEFVVIDDVGLSEEDAEGGVLGLTLQLSTYYQGAE